MFEGKLAEFADDRIDAMARHDLGVFNFEVVVPQLRQIRELGELVDRNIDWVDANGINEVGHALDRAIQAMQTIEEFDPRAAGDPSAAREGYIGAVAKALEPMKRAGVPLFGRDLVRDLASRTGLLDTRSAELGEVLAKAQSQAEAIDAIYRSAKPQAIAIGGRKLADHYRAQTEMFAARALDFMKLGIGALVALVWVSLNPLDLLGPNLSSIDPSAPDAPFKIAIALGPRILLAGLAAYVLRFASRQYGSNRHLEAVNSNRKIALETFDLYSEGAADPTAQGIVLTAVAGAIFRDPATGFIGRDATLKLPGGVSIPTD